MINRLSMMLESPEYDPLLRVALKGLRNPEHRISHIPREELQRCARLRDSAGTDKSDGGEVHCEQH